MRFRHPFITKLAAALSTTLLRLLFRTLRIEFCVVCPHTNPYVKRPPTGPCCIYSVWHDSMVVPIFVGTQRSTVALVSRHRDGAVLAAALRYVGIRAVRGSTSRGGEVAVRQLIDQARDCDIAITPDGPRGPRRKIKPGIVYIASRTGRPIVPTAFAATRAWRVEGSWTDLMIPKPFSRVYCLAGAPVTIPPDLPRDQLDHYVDTVQRAMDELNEQAERLAAGNGSTSAPPAQADTLPKAA